ncbi:MAG: AAA family ATPase [Candidatus Micrarchaeota archaeon]|nr:AAA family ATPase [Candidatus Micrarchaeota archaeon]
MDLPESTKEIALPKDPLEMIIGQSEAVEAARIASKQRRHLLLVGPPGTGKSMIAQSFAHFIPPPRQEVAVLHNFSNPERPVLDVREFKPSSNREDGVVTPISKVPRYIAEKLSSRCGVCGSVTPNLHICSRCGADRQAKGLSPFEDLFSSAGNMARERVYATRKCPDGKEEITVYERIDDEKVRVYDNKSLTRIIDSEVKPRKVIVPLKRSSFVQATGASETELLGDVQHDPYGGHPEVGILPYMRVVPGAIHEAHEGVLFIDEIAHLDFLQRYILTAMQERKFPITGRNASSTGASVRVDGVPCDFILVAALNMSDLPSLLPPLRSRITGNGYEVLLKTHMEDNEENRKKMVQFIAQEIVKDGRIPHANADAILAIISEAKKRAKNIDSVSALTLRLRSVSGVIKLAGDLAFMEGAELIERKHVEAAVKRGRTIEEQVSDRYGSLWRAGASEYGYRIDKGDGKEVA